MIIIIITGKQLFNNFSKRLILKSKILHMKKTTYVLNVRLVYFIKNFMELLDKV